LKKLGAAGKEKKMETDLVTEQDVDAELVAADEPRDAIDLVRLELGRDSDSELGGGVGWLALRIGGEEEGGGGEEAALIHLWRRHGPFLFLFSSGPYLTQT
jgi:hypothetical protein